jgi:Acetyltransferases
MHIRLANMNDLPQLKEMYSRIVDKMNCEGIQVWDEVYPVDFLGDDILAKRLYILIDSDEIASAFALCDSNDGFEHVKWENKYAKALYIDRLGVNIDYLRKGIGKQMLAAAITLAKEQSAEYLRLFVVDTNIPAINLYKKNGFKKANGIYHEVIDDDLILEQFGFEIEITNW